MPDTTALSLQAHAARRQGQLADAQELFREVLRLDSHNIDALYNLGVLRFNIDIEEAENLFCRAICEKSDFPEALNALGCALMRLKRYDEAIPHFEQALATRPDFAEAHGNLGAALQGLGRQKEAIVHFQRAITLQPSIAEPYNNLGKALRAFGRYTDAADHFRKAIAIRPEFAEAHANLGVTLQILGRLGEGFNSIETAIAFSPRTASFYRMYSESTRIVHGDPHFAAMESLAQGMTTLSQEEQLHLHFALGKSYADTEHYDRSFDHFLAGNSLKRKQIHYSEATTLRSLDPTLAGVTPEVIANFHGVGDHSPVPIFIIGMPRSGSTLVEQILACHPKVFAAGERADFAQILQITEGRHGKLLNAGSGDVGTMLHELGAAYVNSICDGVTKAERITDKQLLNFRFVGLIHLALPNARIIHVRRNPIDTCVSCFSTLFASGHEYSYDLGELGRAYCYYNSLMDYWRRILPTGAMLEVDYENVVADLEGQTRSILAHCNLDWDASCLTFHQARRPVHTASMLQVRTPIYRNSIGRWKVYKEKLRPLLDALEPMLGS
jgi:tetratricopeptide (TPR) repeat protein